MLENYSSTATTHALDNLVVGCQADDIVTDSATILTGQALTRGSVLGKITASGKLKLADKAAVDGSAVPFGILTEDTDTATVAGDKNAVVYLAGSFNQDKLVFAAGTVSADLKDSARGNGMYFIKVNAAV